MTKVNSLFSRYLNHMRAAPKQMKHAYAVLFSSVITLFIIVGILYFDYGFWHDRYRRDDAIVEQETIKNNTESPAVMFSRFIKEIEEKASTLNFNKEMLTEGKKSYSSKDEETSFTASSSKK